MDKDSEKKITAESEIGSGGVGHSDANGKSGETKASPEELTAALVASNETIHKMEAELKAMRDENAALRAQGKAPATSDDSINKLADTLAAIVKGNSNNGVVPAEADNINRTSGFKEVSDIDGASLMEAQATMMMYKNEKKVPITIPKAMQTYFGPSLPISVNGVRVSIPVDGKQYLINETHALHARERLAKVDKIISDNSPKISEIGD